MKTHYIYVFYRIRRPLKHIRTQNQFPMSIFDKVRAEQRFSPWRSFCPLKKCTRVTKGHQYVQAVLGYVGHMSDLGNRCTAVRTGGVRTT